MKIIVIIKFQVVTIRLFNLYDKYLAGSKGNIYVLELVTTFDALIYLDWKNVGTENSFYIMKLQLIF